MPVLQYDCCFYLQTKEEQFDQVQSIAGNLLCSEGAPSVITELFEAALQHEINYPPTWCHVALDLDDFQDLFPPISQRPGSCEPENTKHRIFRTRIKSFVPRPCA